MAGLFRFIPGSTPLLINVPHAGTYAPPELAARFTDTARAFPDTDWHVDRLYEFASELGAGLLVATHSRYVVDLNRDPGGAPLYPGLDNTEIVPLLTFTRAPIYRLGHAPGAAEIRTRIAQYWRPYHERLREEVMRLRARHGMALLWDAHSVSSQATRLFDGTLPDLNLGSVKGASADRELIRRTQAVLEKATGFTSVLDGRFTGGYITRHYGRPADGVQALQLEKVWSVYMADEAAPYAYDEARAARLQPVLRQCLQGALEWASEMSDQ